MPRKLTPGRKLATLVSAGALAIASSIAVTSPAQATAATAVDDFIHLGGYQASIQGWAGCANLKNNDVPFVGNITGVGINGQYDTPAVTFLYYPDTGYFCVKIPWFYGMSHDWTNGLYSTQHGGAAVIWIDWEQ